MAAATCKSYNKRLTYLITYLTEQAKQLRRWIHYDETATLSQRHQEAKLLQRNRATLRDVKICYA